MKKFLILIMVSVILNGCYNIKMTNPNVKAGVEVEQWRYHALFGLIQYQDELYTTKCGNKQLASVETSFTFLNMLVNGVAIFLTGGLSGLFFMTNTAKVACAA